MDFQKAAELQYQLKRDPNSAQANLDLAKFYLDDGKLQEGICYLERTVDLNPKDELALNLLGTLYANFGQLGKAEETFRRATTLNPNSIGGYYNLGLLYHRQNRIDEAIESLRKAVQVNPRDAEALNDLGAMLYQKEMHEEAEIHFRRALEAKPDLEDALYNLLDYYYRGNDFTQAKEVIQRLQALSSQDEKLKAIYKECQSKIAKTFSLNEKTIPNRRLNIGFVTIWFERGQSYVTKALRDVLTKSHNTFIFARQGGVYGEAKLETDGLWKVPNLFTYENYHIPAEILEKWIDENDLDAVVFNEEYDWRLIRACKDKGIKVLTYLDYYKDDWKINMKLYDGVLCSTKRTYNLVKDWCKAYYIGWGIDIELFKPTPIENKKYTFFH
ncbi:MAG: tetratricopeptide repeat protein, partial [candidate division Zixibacteria bacterium]|nr:tetratricopeptide repeat protein [candidate division Zixibacteria bacterium]